MASKIVRLCHYSDLGPLFYLKNREKATFGGVFAHLVYDILEYFHRISNCTVNVGHGLGEPIGDSGNFTGCIGQLQSNKSDLVGYISNYPMDVENIEQGYIMFDTDISIGQVYFWKESQRGGQIFGLLAPLTGILLPTAFFLLSVIFTLHIGNMCTRRNIRLVRRILHRLRRMPRRNRYYLYYVLAHCCGFGSILDRKLYCRLLFLCLSFFCLVVISYDKSLIKTSLVVVPNPDVWFSYEDLVRDGIRPIFVKAINTEYYFENSKNKSLRNNFWTYVNNSFKIGDIIVQPSQESFVKVSLSLMKRRSAILLETEFIKNSQLTFCNLKARNVKTLFSMIEHNYDLEDIQRMFNGALFHSSVDPSESKVVKGYIMNKYFTGSTAKQVKRQLRRSFENGLQYAKLRGFRNIDLLKLFFDKNENHKKNNLVRDCLSESVVMPDVEFVTRIGLRNVHTLFVVFFSLLIFAFAVLCLEIWYANY